MAKRTRSNQNRLNASKTKKNRRRGRSKLYDLLMRYYPVIALLAGIAASSLATTSKKRRTDKRIEPPAIHGTKAPDDVPADAGE